MFWQLIHILVQWQDKCSFKKGKNQPLVHKWINRSNTPDQWEKPWLQTSATEWRSKQAHLLDQDNFKNRRHSWITQRTATWQIYNHVSTKFSSCLHRWRLDTFKQLHYSSKSISCVAFWSAKPMTKCLNSKTNSACQTCLQESQKHHTKPHTVHTPVKQQLLSFSCIVTR